MSERQTGATPEQVEAAAKRRRSSILVHYPDAKCWEELDESGRDLFRFEMHSFAPHLVQTDERIVKAADLRAVLRHVWANSLEGDEAAGSAFVRLREVLGDA